MRLDDLCLVNTDVTVSDDFYLAALGIDHRMRNERFVDFVLDDGPRLALWMRPSITETLGAAYPTAPGAPFRITLALPARENENASGGRSAGGDGGASARVLVDPDGFVLPIAPAGQNAGGSVPKIVSVDLAVSDLDASRQFLETLGFTAIAEPANHEAAAPQSAIAGSTASGSAVPGSPVAGPAAGMTPTLSQSTSFPASIAFDAGTTVLTLVDAASIDEGDATWSRSGGHLMLAIELDTGEAVDSAHSLLRARGLVDSGDPAVYEWGARSTYFVDPDAFIWETYAWVEEPR